MGVVGVGGIVWPLINQINPDASVLALSSIEFDLSRSPTGSVGHHQVARHAGVRAQPDAEGNRRGPRRADGSAARIRETRRSTRHQARPRQLADHDRRSARIWAASRTGRVRASSTAGSARATARSTIPPAASAKVPAPKNLVMPPYKFLTRHQDSDRLRGKSDGRCTKRATTSPPIRLAKWFEDRLPLIGLRQVDADRLPDPQEPQLLVDVRRASSPSCWACRSSPASCSRCTTRRTRRWPSTRSS